MFNLIPNHWRRTTLGKIADESGGGIQTGPFGSQLHAEDYVNDGIPSIMPKNIAIDGISTEGIARISEPDLIRLSKYKVAKGDIVYSRRGDVEKCSLITEKEDGWLCGTGCLRVRIPTDQFPPEYLHAYLSHPEVRNWVSRHAVGATMPNLNTSILSDLPFVIADAETVSAIAKVWKQIKSKIQLSHQINQTLEQMAQALFKSWFVDFEPVKAKIAALKDGGSEEDALLAAMQAISGKSPETLEAFQQEQPQRYSELKATAALFPCAMQDSELGEIPGGWHTKNAGDVYDITIGKTPPRKEPHWFTEDDCAVKWLSIKDMGSSDLFTLSTSQHLVPEAIEKHRLKVCEPGTVLLSFKLTVGRVSIAGEGVTTNEAIAHFRIS